MYIYGHLILYCVLRLQRKSPVSKIVVHRHPYDIGNFVDIIDIVVNITRKCKAGERGGREGKIPGARSAQRGPEISVKCSYLVYHWQFPEGQWPVFTNRHFVPGPVVGSRRP
jgi:hypothetical protein